jgi:transposase
MGFKKRYKKRTRRPGSKAYLLEQALLPFVKQYRGKPTCLAIHMSVILGVPVDRREVWKVLRENNNMTLKIASVVPSLSVPEERLAYWTDLSILWKEPDQVVFIDEKKFRNSDVLDDSQTEGYAEIGARLAPSAGIFSMAPILPQVSEVVGAIGSLSSPGWRTLRDGKTIGDVGMISMKLVEGSIKINEVMLWIENDLCPLLNPFPGPRSIVVFDNMPSHRTSQLRLKSLINAKGAVLIWNPPRSPDLNPIEKLWDVTTKSATRRIHELAAGVHGASRRFGWGDLIFCLQEARMSTHCYSTCFEGIE